MSNCPKELRYSPSHEWVRVEADNVITVGITDHAQSQMGDLVFVELPEIDEQVNVGDDVAVVESVKTASDVYAPVSGKVIEINKSLVSAPETVNQDPYGNGWLFRVKVNDQAQLQKLMDAQKYAESIDAH